MKRLDLHGNVVAVCCSTANTRSTPQQSNREASRPMDTIGIDLHKRESQLCTITEDGELLEQRIVTSPARFTAVFGERPAARILLEASTESEWVARHLEALGHQVVVVIRHLKFPTFRHLKFPTVTGGGRYGGGRWQG